jgi:hypothetical protein
MMQVEPLELKHQPFISRSFKSFRTNISDFTFANLFLFRNRWRFRLVRNGDQVIACTTEEGEPCWMPLGDPRGLDRQRLIRIMRDHGTLYPVPEEWLDLFQDGAFTVTCREGEMDYLYRMEKMATFRGGRLNRKRNHLKQFLALYQHHAAPLKTDQIEDAIGVLDAWQAETDLREAETDYGPCLEALHLLDRLHLAGMLYHVEGLPAGFLIGEKLVDTTFVIHFAKGIKTYKGLYEHMFNDAARRLLPRYEYLNLEEDLGRDSLRVTKSSYDPDAMIKKFRVRLSGT